MDHDGGSEMLQPAEVVATWPKGSFVENLAIDAAGRVLVTLHTDQAVQLVNPSTGAVTPFATFHTPVAGLVFDADSRLFVSGGTPGQAGGVIWRVAPDGTVAKAAELPDALFLNGMALHPDGRLLVADSLLGRIYAIDAFGGAVSVWLDDDRLQPPTMDGTPGANGIKLHGGHAFISVTARDTILRCAIAGDGSAGVPDVVAERLRADDFAIDLDGSLYIATHPARSLVRLAPDGTRSTLAGLSQGMLGATAVAFGRTPKDLGCVYVTTTGGTMTVSDDALQEAKLVRVSVHGAPGSPAWNRRLVMTHFEDFVNRRDLSAIERNMAADFLDHDGPGGKPIDRAGDRTMMQGMHAMFPDLRITLHDVLAQHDRVAVRAVWAGTHAQTGKRMRNQGFVLWRIADGLIAERWATVSPMHELAGAADGWPDAAA